MPDTEAGAESARTDATDPAERGESRSLVAGSFRQAFGETDSLLMRSYVVVSAVLGGLLGIFLLLALPVWIFNTLGGSEFATFSRTFLVVGGVVLFAAMVAPVLSSARRHRRETASRRADFLLAASGYLFVLSIYLSLVISVPPDMRETPSGVLAPAVEFLYALPATYALAPPLVALVVIGMVHRFAR
ncbi:hypothetical protein [Halorussus amylolyticus]|uniref:hypothetical protein n=1 Tax=Halorussus amylolyticus TaxID=1126242 RepID=UPI00138F56E0|nr:hypothetical protein [Halorussus amylolyticus]